MHSLVFYPNSKLRKISKPVLAFDEILHSNLDEMYEIMMKNNGVGLAGIQIGIEQRILLALIPDENDEQKKENLIEVINPEILSASGQIVMQEGCLSIPDFYEDITRFRDVLVRFQDRFGNVRNIEASGFLSVVFQHEIDHLDGKLFIDKLSIIKRAKFEKELKQRNKTNKKKAKE